MDAENLGETGLHGRKAFDRHLCNSSLNHSFTKNWVSF